MTSPTSAKYPPKKDEAKLEAIKFKSKYNLNLVEKQLPPVYKRILQDTKRRKEVQILNSNESSLDRTRSHSSNGQVCHSKKDHFKRKEGTNPPTAFWRSQTEVERKRKHSQPHSCQETEQFPWRDSGESCWAAKRNDWEAVQQVPQRYEGERTLLKYQDWKIERRKEKRAWRNWKLNYEV